MNARRVLILDGHTTQALACVRSLGRAGFATLVAGRGRWPLAAWSRWSGGYFRVGDETPAGYAELRRWAEDRGVTSVLPMTERSCLLCNADRDAWEVAGIGVGCGAEALLLRAFDKAQTIQAAQTCAVAIPPTRLPASEEECRAAAEEVGYPCVVKSRFSEAWVGGTFLRGGGASYVSRAADLEQIVRAHRQGPYWPIIQGFVRGQGKGVSGLCDHGRVVTLIAHERLRDVRPTGSGSSLRRSIRLDSRLRAPVERLLAELKWHGPVMVEFRDDGGATPCLMEVNGRFWGSLHLAIAAGVDVPRWWVAMLDDAEERIEPMTGYTEGVTVRWLWGDVKRFLKILAGPPEGYPDVFPTPWEGLKEQFGPQPPGTLLETWDPADRWPAVAEWVTGAGQLVEQGLRRIRRDRRQEAAVRDNAEQLQVSREARAPGVVVEPS